MFRISYRPGRVHRTTRSGIGQRAQLLLQPPGAAFSLEALWGERNGYRSSVIFKLVAPLAPRFGHLVLNVDDMDAALRFYRDTLGFAVVGAVNPIWTVVDARGVKLTLFLQPKGPRLAFGRKKDDSPLYLHVQNFELAAKTLESAGQRVVRVDHRQGVTWDPAGNAIGLHDHRVKKKG